MMLVIVTFYSLFACVLLHFVGSAMFTGGDSAVYVGCSGKEFHLGPYHTEHTASRPICEVKHCRAESVVRWGTTREYSGAPGLEFLFASFLGEGLCHLGFYSLFRLFFCLLVRSHCETAVSLAAIARSQIPKQKNRKHGGHPPICHPGVCLPVHESWANLASFNPKNAQSILLPQY